MNLSENDADLFYKLMRSLQCYVNQKTNTVPDLSTPDDIEDLSREEKIALREEVYKSPQCITDYIQENPYKLDPAALEIISGWTNFVDGSFYIERYLKNHAILVGNHNVYAVKALYDPFDLIMPKEYLPRLVRAVLLPFKGEIIFDGLMQSQNISFGGSMKYELKEDYMRAKQNERIIDTLPPSAKPKKKVSKDWTKQLTKLEVAAKPLKGGAGQPLLNAPTFSLIKNSIELAKQTTSEPADVDAIYEQLESIKRTISKIENTLYRMD